MLCCHPVGPARDSISQAFGRKTSRVTIPTGYPSLSLPSFQKRDNDSAIGLLEIHHGVNLGPFLDELFRLHFKNIHPYYPVIDEFMFEENFSFTISDDQKRQDRAVALCAMLLCASMVSFTSLFPRSPVVKPTVVSRAWQDICRDMDPTRPPTKDLHSPQRPLPTQRLQ